MAVVIRQVEEAVAQLARQIAPDFMEPAQFVPTLDFSRGDLVCEVAFEVATRLRRPPSVIAESIAESFRNSPLAGGARGFNIEAERGYLNIRCPQNAEFWLALEGLEPPPPSPLVVVVSCGTSWRPELWRVWTRGFFQAVLASRSNYPARFYALNAAGMTTIVPCMTSSESLLHAAPNVADSSVDNRLAFFDQLVREHPQTIIQVWVEPELFESRAFRHWLAGRQSNAAKMQFHSLRLGVSGFERVQFPARESAEGAWPLVVAMAAVEHGQELDPTVINRHERDNLLWYIPQTRTRILRIASEIGESKDDQKLISLSASELLLLKRLAFMDLFRERAIRGGKVQLYLCAVREFLDGVNRWFNQPDTRRRWQMSGLTPVETKIFTGAEQVLSAMILCLGSR